jgi:hypothetical protein
MDAAMKNNKMFLLIIIGIYILTLLAISTNLNTPYLWFDEAGQFFISKGLNHDSNPLEKEKGLAYVVENNAFYNMDPGGFSILLHFWSKISNSHIWLRFLPFLFFIGIVLSFIYLSYLWLKNINIALLMGFIPILIPMILRMAFEVRAYSMEGLGTIISIVALENIKNKISYKHLLIWSCVLSFLMTSRYSEIVVVFVVSIYVIFLILNSNMSLKKKLLSSVIYSIPLIATLFYIYFSALIYQNRDLTEISHLPYISSNLLLLLDPGNFLFLCVIGLLIIIYFLKNRYPIIKKYEIPLFVMIVVNVLFILLSILGKHPWAPYSSKCISLFLLVLLCISAFLGELLKPLFTGTDILKYYFIVSTLIFTLYLGKETLFIRQNQNNTYYDIVKNGIVEYNRIYVDRFESPCIRYLFEYGKLKTKKKDLYPDKFTFGKYHRHGFYEGKTSREDFFKAQPKMNDYLDYDLLITPELFKYGFNDKWTLISGTTNFYIQKDDNKNK